MNVPPEQQTLRYYAAVKGEDLPVVISGPYRRYDDVMGYHAEQLNRYTYRVSDLGPRVLLDVHSVQAPSGEVLDDILGHDPVLRSIYELGRRKGFAEAVGMYRPAEGAGTVLSGLLRSEESAGDGVTVTRHYDHDPDGPVPPQLKGIDVHIDLGGHRR